MDQKQSNSEKGNGKTKTPKRNPETESKVKYLTKKSKTRNRRERQNKIYRTPPTPSPSELLKKEKTFILDCNATSSISQDYSGTNPKLGPVIPPYNSQRDKHVGAYFKFWGVGRTLKKTGQFKDNATSIEGPVSDRFHQKGPGFEYLSLRNQSGAGHSQETIDGHAQFMKGITSVSGYNGRFGFRRNTPWLRKTPTQFGQHIIFPTH
ncbi:unnamed protein product [Candidula unifasciata]|uniref:Uncharacterized protein n=1 Tax=Candidula unifasciata TaxID=100452 RepID=A0A8S3ZWD2_9EUPU|nr:unnamed protein product [Candidula unifasciata]